MQNVAPSSEGSVIASHSVMSSEAQVRSNTYSILASLLSSTPSLDLLDYLKHIATPADADEDVGEMGHAWLALKSAALEVDIDKLDDEFHTLFIGVGRGAIVPFGSWHITGFLMDKPLSELRDDLKALGIESDENEKDPEDHIAALCECMSLIINADDIDESRERQFFIRHIKPWAEKFFQELQAASSAAFYKPVGALGQAFMQLESQYLNINTH